MDFSEQRQPLATADRENPDLSARSVVNIPPCYLGSDTVKYVFVGVDGITEYQDKSVIDREKGTGHYH
jgi:hypothetical protein